MIPASANIMEEKSITGAATGQKTLVMRIPKIPTQPTNTNKIDYSQII
jgi:hypothetical protein